jgi:hypothetical protein
MFVTSLVRGRAQVAASFGTPRTMTVRLVADIQNRLFWRVGTGRARSAAFPPRDGVRHPEMCSDVPAEQPPAGL